MRSALVELKNVQLLGLEKASLNVSKSDLPIFSLLEKEGFIRSYEILSNRGSNKLTNILVYLAYYKNSPMIRMIQFFNKTDPMTYSQIRDITLNSQGVFLVSTSLCGICTHKTAIANKVGGKLIAYIQ